MSGSIDKAENPLAGIPLPGFLTNKDQPIGWAFSSFVEFIQDSKRLLQRCTKPDAREFKNRLRLLDWIRYHGIHRVHCELVFIPINNIIVGMGM